MGEWVHARSEGIIEGLSRPISDLRGPDWGPVAAICSLSKGIPIKKQFPFHILVLDSGVHVTFAEVWEGFAHTYMHCLQLTRPGTFIEMGKI